MAQPPSSEAEEQLLEEAMSFLLPPPSQQPQETDSAFESEPLWAATDAAGKPVPIPTTPIELLLCVGQSKPLGAEAGEGKPKKKQFPALKAVATFAAREREYGGKPRNFLERGIAMQEQVAKRREEVLRNRQAAEMEEATFHPVINEKSKSISKSNQEEGFYSAGLAWRKQQDKKFQKKVAQFRREQKEEEELQSTPWKISKKSDMLASRRRQQVQREYEVTKDAVSLLLEHSPPAPSARLVVRGEEDLEGDEGEEELLNQEEGEERDSQQAAESNGCTVSAADGYNDMYHYQYHYSPPPSVTISEPSKLWTPKKLAEPVHFAFSPSLNDTSRLLHQARVELDERPLDCIERMEEDCSARRTRDVCSCGTVPYASPGTPRRQQSDIDSMLTRLSTPKRHVSHLPAECTFRPKTTPKPTYSRENTIEMDSVRRYPNTKERKDEERRRKALQESTSGPSAHQQASITPKQFDTFLERQDALVKEKATKYSDANAAKVKQQEKECTFTPKIKKYELSSPIWSASTFTPEVPTPTPRKSTRNEHSSSAQRSELGARPRSRANSASSSSRPKAVRPYVPSVCRVLEREPFSFVHDKQYKEEFAQWFKQMDKEGVGWIPPTMAMDAVRSLAGSLGCTMQHVDVEADFPSRIHFADFILLLSRSIRMPARSS